MVTMVTRERGYDSNILDRVGTIGLVFQTFFVVNEYKVFSLAKII